jgi:hypothetical protein
VRTDVDLPPRRRLTELNRRADDRGEFAELLVAEMFDALHTPDETEWYDCRSSSGTKYEVKSTETELGNGAPGRFRLWDDQHRSLLASSSNGTAWYVFVLFEDAGIRDIRRTRPPTVTRLVQEVGNGEWDLSGHARGEQQQKLPWEAVF